VVLPDADKLWPADLRRIDQSLDDADVIEVIACGLEARWPASRRRGRPGTPAEVVLRMLMLKHLYGLSYADLEQDVRANLVYRAFARISCDRVPDAKTILKIAKALGPEVIATLHQCVVALAVATGVAKGRRFRIDTPVVETNVHSPTDSSLLADGGRQTGDGARGRAPDRDRLRRARPPSNGCGALDPGAGRA
jgi:IS5 family transposase